jgi:hypothetical protein
MEAFEERLKQIEDILGLDVADQAPSADTFDVVPVKKRLQELELGFLLQIPKEKLIHLNEVVNKIDTVSLAEKSRAVEFASGLIEKRANMLEEVQRLSDVALNSAAFTKAVEMTPSLQQARTDLDYMATEICRFDAEVREFCDDFIIVLKEFETRIAKLERSTQMSSTA